MLRVFLFIGLFFFIQASVAYASVLNCAPPVPPALKERCENKEMIALDVKSETLYLDLFLKLSDSGKEDIKRSQANWLSFVAEVCEKDQACFDLEYLARKEILEHSLFITREGLVIYKVMQYFTYPPEPDADPVKKFYTSRRAFPKIDNPDKDQEAFNHFMAHDTPQSDPYACEDRRADFMSDYTVGYTAPNFVSIEMDAVWRCDNWRSGGFSSRDVYNRLIDDRSDVFPRDVFDPSSDWKNAIFEIAYGQLSGVDHQLQNIKDTLTESYSWKFTDAGIAINLGKLNGFSQLDEKVVLPWEQLKPYLAKNRPFLLPFENITKDKTTTRN